MTDPAPLDAATSGGPGASDMGASFVAASHDPAATGTVMAPTGTDAAGRPWPPFAHGSETEMARILDFYDVRWQYEPRTFPILWNLDGDVVESFSPDFYLPDLDLFLELTTLKQRLVRKKNRKLRRLRELYPDIRIKLFYARDFRAMMLKYGRLALADSMSGTLGQVVPDRGREPDLEPAMPGDAPQRAVGSGGDAPGASTLAAVEIGPAPGIPGSGAGDPAEAAQHLSVAEPGSGAAPAARRNASRSRRRRAAAAARAAAREPVDAATRRTAGQRQEDSTSR